MRITPNTHAIVPTHLYGQPCDMDPIMSMARSHQLAVIEDCAHALGATYKGRKVGTFGDMAIFSFQMNKNMTAGEGGCVVTRDLRLYRRAVACHDLGYARDEEGRKA